MKFLTQLTHGILGKHRELFSGPIAKSLELLVLQPTPFCNINCDYCYLADRDSSFRMTIETIKASVGMVLGAGLVSKTLYIVWHAGEPLVLPVSYYEEAFRTICEIVDNRCSISQSVQTNGTLIDDRWCRFFKKYSVRVGVSIDGPSFIHDAHRKTRGGKPTHARVMEGIRELRDHGVPFHVIAVVTSDSLDHASSMFSFFKELGTQEIGFNVEELEGENSSSSLMSEGQRHRINRFWQQLYDLYERSDGNMRIREFERARKAILLAQTNKDWSEIACGNDQVLPFRMITVNCYGGVSTFSPELIGTRDTHFTDFIFGHVGREDFAVISSSESFRRVAREVWNGVGACARNCEYFCVCGGGAPANKYFENHSLSSTETMFCRSAIQAPVQVVLGGLEKKLGLRNDSTMV
jgi:uncharacterized protein